MNCSSYFLARPKVEHMGMTGTLSVVGDRIHYACSTGWSTDFKFVDDSFVVDVHSFTRVK